jgi:hypothetical protein
MKQPPRLRDLQHSEAGAWFANGHTVGYLTMSSPNRREESTASHTRFMMTL